MHRLNSRVNRAVRAAASAVLAVLAACGGSSEPAADESTFDSSLERSAVAVALATTAGSGGETVYTEAGKLVRADLSIEALDTGLFGEKVNLYNGTVDFVQTDFSVPGNSALPVSVGRKLGTGTLSLTVGIFGDWDLELPRMQGVYA